MTTEQAVEKLKSSGNRFDVSIPLEGSKEKKLVELATLDTFGKDRFSASLETNQELIVRLRPKRGAVYNIGEYFRVSNPTTPQSPIKMQTQTLGQPQADLMQFILSSKEEKINDQNRIITSLENAVKSSEKEVLELKQKNMDLERENKLKDAQFAIERKSWEADKEREDFTKDKERLSGVDVLVGGAEKIAANPAVLEIIKLAFASRAGAQPSLAPHSDIMPKPQVAHFVKNFSDWMNQQDEKTAGTFFNIVAQMSKHPETWSQVKQVIFPQQQAA